MSEADRKRCSGGREFQGARVAREIGVNRDTRPWSGRSVE